MKELILAAILAGNIYPMSGKVVIINSMNDTVTFQTKAGFLYDFYTEDGDWMIGDNVAVIMSDNGTHDDVTDDEVLAVRYAGYDE